MSEPTIGDSDSGAPGRGGEPTGFFAQLKKRPWFGWVSAAVLLGVAGVIVKTIEATPSYISEKFSDKKLIDASALDYDGPCKGYILKAQTLDELDTAPYSESSRDSEEYEIYGRAHGTITSPQRVMITITGFDERPVTLNSMRIVATEKKSEPLTGVTMENQCGDETVARYAEVDLDAEPPRIVDSSADVVSYGSVDPETDEPLRTKPLQFPYTVKNDNTESLLIIANTNGYVEWHAEFAWSNGEKKGRLTVDQDGEPFKVTSGAKSVDSVTPSEEGWYHFTESSTDIIPNR